MKKPCVKIPGRPSFDDLGELLEIEFFLITRWIL